MQKTQFPSPVQSCDLARAACLARQIQTIALSGPAEADLDMIEAVAEALAYRLERGSAALEGAGH